VLGETRRKEVGARMEARYTMQSERDPTKAKVSANENEIDGVELF
jgi:hypothetical protein